MGYCASKKQWCYGFKLHLQVTDQGLPMGYVVTEASCRGVKAAETVMTQIPHPRNMGDKGCISRALREKLYEKHRVAFWTPSRHNPKHHSSDTWEEWIKKKRKGDSRGSIPDQPTFGRIPWPGLRWRSMASCWCIPWSH